MKCYVTPHAYRTSIANINIIFARKCACLCAYVYEYKYIYFGYIPSSHSFNMYTPPRCYIPWPYRKVTHYKMINIINNELVQYNVNLRFSERNLNGNLNISNINRLAVPLKIFLIKFCVIISNDVNRVEFTQSSFNLLLHIFKGSDRFLLNWSN